MNIEEINKKYLSKELTVKDFINGKLDLIKERENLNAIRGIFSDIESQVLAAQKLIDEGKSKELTGIPFIVKDNILVKGQNAEASSKILENYIASYDATVISKLKKEGAVLIARANMDEFAMGGSTENSAYGPTKNPIDESRVPGGSSGGSAAALAADMCTVSLGTDTGGSIRQPAAFCGVVGLKPTYGAVSRYGAIAMGSSLDQIGPFTKSVRDMEIVFNVIKGQDDMDATTISDAEKKEYVKNKKIGIPYDFVKKEGVDKEVIENFEKNIEALKNKGYEIVDISMPYLHYALSVYYILMPAEVSSNLARFDGIRYGLSINGETSKETFEKTRGAGFGKEVKRRILLGTYILSHGYYDAYYNKAILVRNKIKEQFENIFKDVSFVMTPTTPTTAFKIGEKSNDPLEMYLADIFTVPANIAGVPAISIPSGKDKKGMPFAVQVTSPNFCEDWLFEIGKDIENLIQ